MCQLISWLQASHCISAQLLAFISEHTTSQHKKIRQTLNTLCKGINESRAGKTNQGEMECLSSQPNRWDKCTCGFKGITRQFLTITCQVAVQANKMGNTSDERWGGEMSTNPHSRKIQSLFLPHPTHAPFAVKFFSLSNQLISFL